MTAAFRFFLLVVATTVGGAHALRAQAISGIVNTYAKVLGIAGNTLTVSQPALFAPGDYVLLIQMQGVSINTSNNASFGDITAYNSAGNFELGQVASINGSDVVLSAPLSHSYDVNASVQLIRVPTYCNATVVDTLTCKPWDGSTGGVLAVICYGSLELQADVDVSGKGFRGGPTCVGGWGCNNTNYYLNNVNCSGGKKGEGIYLVSNNMYSGGRGKIANGGGGGNPGNCGGGGGSNFGQGGLGGYEYNLCFTTIQGIGGQALDYTLGKIFMGGAGGTGFNDNMQIQYPGAHGGGIILLFCDTLKGNGFGIRSRGLDVAGITNDESAGGGGAGGVVVLAAQEISGPVTLDVSGGKGGDTFNNIFVGQCHGPGGGGGGGVIWLSGATTPPGVTTLFGGGQPGLVLNPLSVCFNTSWGASAGGDGAVLYNFSAISIQPAKQVNLIGDTTLCPGQQIVLDAGNSFAAYEWNDGSTQSTLTATAPGTYSVKVTDSSGCVSSDTVILSAFPAVSVNYLHDTIVCPGEEVTLIAGTNANTYQWNTGSSDSSVIADLPGWYWVVVTDSLGCMSYDSVLVSHHALVSLNLGDDFSICQNDTVLLFAGTYASYLWNTQSTDSAIAVYKPGAYWVTVVDTNGCVQRDTIQLLSLYALPPDDFMRDTVVCPPVGLQLSAPLHFATYLWNSGATEAAVSINEPGWYWVEVTNEHGCRNRDTFQVDSECPTDIWFPNAFTPNSDGVNDVYRLIGYNIKRFHMMIFNRWGELVFVTDQLDRGWDGQCSGVPCEVGVYVYVADFMGELHGVTTAGRRKGNITLIR
ncbi:MAG: gliding motility-associated C-terminal domain-containing protein [Chitinophagales bacterium]|nr:gliding motility-associated C-terminal domain-containing protein [Chitinophagales bacterium]MDW8427979.1 gliding motility-associated C-terminal domain-containing protein [Chitinophagales bacterium]